RARSLRARGRRRHCVRRDEPWPRADDRAGRSDRAWRHAISLASMGNNRAGVARRRYDLVLPDEAGADSGVALDSFAGDALSLPDAAGLASAVWPESPDLEEALSPPLSLADPELPDVSPLSLRE